MVLQVMVERGNEMAGDKMTKARLVATIADDTGLPKKDIENVFGALHGLLKKQLGRKGPGELTIPGIVKLRVVKKKATKAREGRNPATGEKIVIPAKKARKVVKATVLKATKDLV
jgi:nucleoid DNA-binding protein